MIKIEALNGDTVLLWEDDIYNIWRLAAKNLTVVNFKQGGEKKEVWTEETVDSLQKRINDGQTDS